MAIDHMDNYNIYGTNTALMTQGIYAQIEACTLQNDPDGVSTSRVIRGNNSFGTPLYGTIFTRYAFQTGPTPKAGIALRQWLASLPTAPETVQGMEFRGVGNQRLCTLGVTSNGGVRINVWQGSGNQQFTEYDFPVPVVSANAWWHLEAVYERTGTNTCSAELRVEGQTVASVTNVPCRAFDPAQSGPGCSINGGGNAESYYKDVVWWNGLGGNNDTFLGSVLVTNLVPTSDVALNWTPSTGSTGYEILDNNPPNDAQYISADDSPPAAYVAGLSNLPPDITSVRAVMTIVRAAKSDGGDGSLQVSVISDGTPGAGADRPITVTQTYWRDIFPTDPDTGSAWLPAAVDAAELELNRTT